MKKKARKLYRFITEGKEDDDLVDIVPDLEEEDEEKKDEDKLDEEEVVNAGNKDSEIETQKKAADAQVDDKLTEEDESEEDKEVTESDDFDADNELKEEEEEDEKEVTEETDSDEDKKEVTEEDEEPELEEDSKLDSANASGAVASTLSPTNSAKEGQDQVAEEEEEEELEEADGSEELQKKTDDEIEKIDVKEDVRALISGRKLSSAFQGKIKTIFESAVKKHVKNVVKKLQEQYNSNLSKIEKKLSRKLINDTNKYMNYVVENWMQENKLAVERGIRTEITEEFISSFKTLCEQHNINMPESKIDVVEKLNAKLEKTESRLNEALNQNIKLHKLLNEGRKAQIIRSISKGLTSTQSDKLATLAEGVVFKNSEEFTASVKLLKESYFPKNTKSSKGEVLVEGGLVKPNSNPTSVDVYAKYIESTVKN